MLNNATNIIIVYLMFFCRIRLKLIHYNDDLEIRLQLWDIAGQERFSSMTRAYYKGTMGAIVVFDHSNAKTYQAAVDRWKRDLDDKCSLPGNRSVPAILVANKVDLKRDPALPDDLEISRTVQERGFVPKWYKTSGKHILARPLSKKPETLFFQHHLKG